VAAPEAFALDPRLAGDTHRLGRFPLCLVLLMNDSRYPWFILVPQRPGLREIYELDETGQQQLMRESAALGRAAMAAFAGAKLNVAALGNVVPQLHLHHIVRYENDPAWPGPVWGRLPPLPYAPDAVAHCIERLRPHLQSGFRWG
jgi:diadenosine tetraphosphate (Ap4A) HIT family hydrolase